MFRRFLLFTLLSLCVTSFSWAANKIDYRYWFDGDSIATNSGHSAANAWQMEVDVSSLTEAIHTIHLQAIDKDGVASSPVTRYFLKTSLADKPVKVVYCVDNDLTPLATSTVTNGTVLLDVSKLPDGFHYLHVQAVGNQVSPNKTYCFIKTPIKDPNAELNCLCWIDGTLFKQEKLPANGGIISWELDVTNLSQGVHHMQLQAIDDKGNMSRTFQTFFLRIPTSEEQSNLNCVCWIDGNIFKQEDLPVYGGIINWELDVTELPLGIHHLQVQAYGNNGISSHTYQSFFLRVPTTEERGDLNCICWIDGEIFKQEKLPIQGGLLNWQLDVSGLPQGIHYVQVQALDDNGVSSSTYQSFFLRVPTTEERGNLSCYYDIDGENTHQLATNLVDGTYHFDIDVSNLEDGPHRLSCMLTNDNGGGSSSHIINRYFIKVPIGGYGVKHYNYWLNDSMSQAVNVVLDKPADPFKLITLLPFDHWPIRSSSFEFKIEDDQPVIYARNDMHVRFFDASDRFIDISRTFTDPVIKEDVTDITLIEPGETKTAPRPQENEILWYKVSANRGDSICFKADRTCTIQIFSPSGDELKSASREKSVQWMGSHATEDGTYYIAQHDMTASQGNSLAITYQHIDKYALLSYTPNTFGITPGVVEIDIEGNGLDHLVQARLIKGETEFEIDSILNKSKADAVLPLTLYGEETEGLYDLELTFEDEGIQSTIIKSNAVCLQKAQYGSVLVSIRVTNYARRPLLTVSVKNTGNVCLQFVPLNFAFNKIDGMNTMEFEDFLIFVDSVSAKINYKPFVITDSFRGNNEKALIVNSFIPQLNPHETQVYNIAFTGPINYTFDFYAWAGNAVNTNEAWNEGETNIPSLITYYKKLGLLSSTKFSSTQRAPSMCDIIQWIRSIYNHIREQYNLAQQVQAPWTATGHAIGNSIIGMQYTIDDAWIEASEGLLTEEDFGRQRRPLPPPSSFVEGYAGDALRIWEQQQQCSNNNQPNPIQQPVLVHAPGDPNEMRGYVAISGSHAIGKDVEKVNYTIEFENDPEIATTSAHTIIVTDTIDGTKFDLQSFSPTSVSLGDIRMQLDGEQSFVKTMDLRPAINTIAQVELKYDNDNGVAKWLLTSLDPMSVEPTNDPMQGILPVNIDGNGVGLVTYDISLKGNLPEGTEIKAHAAIKFDAEDVIITPDWVNIIDGVKPTSRVIGCELLNDSVASVTIRGEDDRSGPWRYDIYTQYGDGGEWYKTASEVPIDRAAQVRVYEGIKHHFYAVLTDSADNVETKQPVCELTFDYFSSDSESNLTLNLARGWNWMSHNLNAPLSIDCLKPNAHRILSHDGETINDPRYGYTGTVSQMSPTELYKAEMSVSENIPLSGLLFNSALKPIPLVQGWNWMGYPMPGAMSVNEALILLEADEDDCIVGQNGSAVYNDGLWRGTLTTLEPGKGYLLKVNSDKSLRFNTSRSSVRLHAPAVTGQNEELPWTVDIHRYPNVTPVIADLWDGNTLTSSVGYALAAFVDDECRGIATEVNGRWMMNVFGNGGETITFKALDRNTGLVHDVTETQSFTADLLGTMAVPVQLHIADGAGLNNVTYDDVNVKPTMTTGPVTIEASVTIDDVEVINMAGMTIMGYSNIPRGFTLDLSSEPDGVYLVKVHTGSHISTVKVMKRSR